MKEYVQEGSDIKNEQKVYGMVNAGMQVVQKETVEMQVEADDIQVEDDEMQVDENCKEVENGYTYAEDG